MILDLEGGLLVAAVIVWLIALAESITADEAQVRNLPKIIWIVLVLIAFPVGAVLWFFLGRPRRGQAGVGRPRRQAGGRPPRPRPSAPTGPDDDPGFLDSLNKRT